MTGSVGRHDKKSTFMVDKSENMVSVHVLLSFYYAEPGQLFRGPPPTYLVPCTVQLYLYTTYYMCHVDTGLSSQEYGLTFLSAIWRVGVAPANVCGFARGFVACRWFNQSKILSHSLRMQASNRYAMSYLKQHSKYPKITQ